MAYDNFRITTPSRASPVELVVYGYQYGAFLNVFDGLYIADTSGSLLSAYGIGGEYRSTVPQHLFTICATTNRIDYDITVKRYYAATTLDSFSGSTLGEMSPETLLELALLYIG